MNTFASVIFLIVIAASANAGLVAYSAAIPTGHIIQGPSSRTTVVGPDGSSISAVAPGGTIVADDGGAAIVSQAAPAALIAPAPGFARVVAPVYGGIAAENTLVAGPSGTISQTRAIDGAPVAYL